MERRPRLHGLFVLVVDDHVDTAEMLHHALREAGAVAVSATSADHALHLASQMLPDVLVVDIAMPDRDGFWFLREFQKLPNARPVPSIALTGAPLDLLPDHFKDAGFSRALLKPVTPGTLCENIVEVVEERVIASAIQRSPLVVGDLVTTTAKADWVGEVVNTSRLGNGYVVVRWRTSSGMSLQATEESTRSLVRVRPISRDD
jgi:CheY-like chemotaxis protein